MLMAQAPLMLQVFATLRMLQGLTTDSNIAKCLADVPG